MKNTTSKKLLKYGTLSAAALGCSIANSQIVYTDIDDIDVFDNGPFINLDINADGIEDFVAIGGPYSAFVDAASFDGTSLNSNNNAFVGFSTSSYAYASSLAEGDIIDANATFASQGERAILNITGCIYSSGQFCGGVINAYVGFSFEIGSATHYGWLRVDVSSTASRFVLKDYAYEATPDVLIEAGNNGALSLEDNVINGFSSFVDTNNVLQLNAHSPLSAISVYNITGQEVMSKELSNTAESIDINALNTGVYIARVAVEGTETAIKFVKK